MPATHLACVDVRDVALAHIRAMQVPEAAGNRHLLCTQSFCFLDLAKICAEEFGSQGYEVPKKTAPYFLMKLRGFFDQNVRMILPKLRKDVHFNNTRMKEVLDIQPVDPRVSVIDMNYDAIEYGFVKKTAEYKGCPTNK